jgi:PhnB protein
MRARIFLSFDGQCEAALRFYARALGGKVRVFTWGTSPMAHQAPDGWADKVLHGSVSVGDSEIAAADVPSCPTPQGFSIMLNIDGPEQAQRAFDALNENATILLPMQQTFWSASYGILVDQFGIRWEINCQQAPGR